MRRVATGVDELDKMTGGGLFEKSTTLVAGAPGTGKTTLGVQFIVAGAENNEPGIIVTFEEFPEVYYRDSLNYGWDLKEFEEQGKLKIMFTSPSIFKTELEREMGVIDKTVIELGAKRILIDPITHFHYVTQEPSSLRGIYNSLVNGLRRAGLTSILTCETSSLFGGLVSVGERMPFVVDNIISLKYVEIDGEVKRALVVVKTRGSSHARDIREFTVTDKGIKIDQPFKGYEGLLSSSPRKFSPAEVARQFFE